MTTSTDAVLGLYKGELHLLCPHCKTPTVAEHDVSYRDNSATIVTDANGKVTLTWRTGEGTDWETTESDPHSCSECFAGLLIPQELLDNQTWI